MSEINLITKDSVLPEIRPFSWDVMIDGIPYYVAKIEGFVHTIGGKYGENDLWAYPRNEKPTYENLVEFQCDNPVSWGIEYKPHNYLHYHWDEYEARSSGSVIITRNGEKFCDVELAAGINYGIDMARVLITELQDHPLGFNEIDFDKKMIGRRVWWRSQPAIIESYIKGQGCVILVPDGFDRFDVPNEFKYDDCLYDDEDGIKTTVFDKHIWWFREESERE